MCVKDFVSEKIDEIFLEYQKERLVSSGDIYPLDALCLSEIKNKLACLIEKVCSYQPKVNHYVWRDKDGEEHVVDCAEYGEDMFFSEISKRICYDDCTGEYVVVIFWNGETIHYAGWQPGMKYEYRNMSGETVWVGYFEEWDH